MTTKKVKPEHSMSTIVNHVGDGEGTLATDKWHSDKQ
jgi:hypothetical protein